MSEDTDQLWQERAKSHAPRWLLVKRMLWSAVQGTLYRYSFHTANGWRALLLRMFGARVAGRCTIRRTSRVYYPWNLDMGELSCLGDDCNVYNLGPVTLGRRVTLSQESYLCAGTHDYEQLAMPLVTPPIILRDDAWVCARAFIGPGVVIGEGAIVGAAAVAMRDVPEWTVVAGNPATFVKVREKPK